MSEIDNDKVVDIDFLKINYSRNKFCKCYDKFPRKKPQFEIDIKNRVVECRYCHIMIDPFEALVNIAKYFERIQESIENAKAYKNELITYKPYLRQAKRYEKMMREKDMLPVCPKCNKAFRWENLCSMINKKFYEE